VGVGDTVVVNQLHRLETVEVMDQVVALADDVILVPVLVLVVPGVDQLFLIVHVADDFLVAFAVDEHQVANVDQPSATAFMIQEADLALVVLDLGLVAGDPPLVELLAAVLDAGVAVADGGILRRRFPANDTVLDRPEPPIAIPSGQVLAVEDPFPVADAKFAGRAPKKRHALRDFGHGIQPVVLVFDGEAALKTLTCDFLQHQPGLAHTGAPGDIVGAADAEFVEVFEVEASDSADSAERLDRLERIDPRTRPVARIGAGADPFAATLAHLQHGLVVPVVRRLGVVMDRHADLVLLAELVDQIEGILGRLRDDRLDSHVPGEFEDRLTLALVVGQADHAVID